jgi:hypothetical protein
MLAGLRVGGVEAAVAEGGGAIVAVGDGVSTSTTRLASFTKMDNGIRPEKVWAGVQVCVHRPGWVGVGLKFKLTGASLLVNPTLADVFGFAPVMGPQLSRRFISSCIPCPSVTVTG